MRITITKNLYTSRLLILELFNNRDGGKGSNCGGRGFEMEVQCSRG